MVQRRMHRPGLAGGTALARTVLPGGGRGANAGLAGHKAFGHDPDYGPFKEAPDEELKLAAAAQLRSDIWEHGSVRSDHRRRLDRLHGQWVRGAFRQVAERTGQHHAVYVRPRVAWVEAAKLARRRALPIASRAMVWFGDRLMQLVACAEVGSESRVCAMARQVDAGQPPGGGCGPPERATTAPGSSQACGGRATRRPRDVHLAGKRDAHLHHARSRRPGSGAS